MNFAVHMDQYLFIFKSGVLYWVIPSDQAVNWLISQPLILMGLKCGFLTCSDFSLVNIALSKVNLSEMGYTVNFFESMYNMYKGVVGHYEFKYFCYLSHYLVDHPVVYQVVSTEYWDYMDSFFCCHELYCCFDPKFDLDFYNENMEMLKKFEKMEQLDHFKHFKHFKR